MSEDTTRLPAGVERLRNYIALWRISPCRSVEKDQDRADLADTDAACFVTISDGATQSARSGEAAEILSRNPAELWVDGMFADRVERLHKLREELIASGPSQPVDEKSFLSRTLAHIEREKKKCAFQSTLVTARIAPRAGGGMLLEAKTCGDSALLVFDRYGRLCQSRPKIADESSAFGHLSAVTDVLPDDFRAAVEEWQEPIDADAHVVLCTDGFYDAFANPSALLRWLLLNANRIDAALEGLHERLEQIHGDDDITFVWLCPRALERPVAPAPRANRDDSAPRGLLAGVVHLLRRYVPWVARTATLCGGIES